MNSLHRFGPLTITQACNALAVLITCSIILPQAAAQIQIDTMVLVGEPAPGFGPGATFSSNIYGDRFEGFFDFRTPYLNDAGQVLFGGESHSYPLGDENDDGLWVSNLDGSLRMVVRERTPAPGTDAEFGNCADINSEGYCSRSGGGQPFEILGVSNAGQGVFLSRLVGPTVRGKSTGNFEGIWSERGGNGLHPVVRQGDPTPGFDDTFGRFSISQRTGPVPTNSNGLVTFIAEFASDRSQEGLWVEEPAGGLRLVAKTGDLAPGVGQPFADFDTIRVGYIDAAGDVVFSAEYYDEPQRDLRRGIWRGTSQGVEPVVTPGDPFPWLAGDRVFDSAFPRSISDNGNLVFTGAVAALPEDPFSYNGGLFASSDAGIRKVLLLTDEIPEFPGNVFSPTDAVIDDLGRVAFTVPIDRGSRPNALYAERDGELRLIAGPGTLPGFEGDETIDQIGSLSTNQAGQIVFAASIQSPCSDPADPFQCDVAAGHHYAGEGIWMAQESGDLDLIVRSGDRLEVSPGDLREVYSLSLLDGPGINALGQMAFAVQFRDGTQGVFRAQYVPEPSGFGLSLCACMSMLLYQRWLTKVGQAIA